MTDAKKITIDLNLVNLENLDLLVEQGIYSIRIAVRKRKTVIQKAITRRAFGVGIIIYSASDLKKKQANNEKLNIRLIGLLFFQNDITPELALATIDSLSILGSFRANPEVKKALKGRIK